VRRYLVLGHRLEVVRAGDGRWSVAVDGEGLRSSFVHPYAAWAAGAAESYRRGRGSTSEPLSD
jgi:hypothetical protein